jgi:hypothetical protein
VDEFVNEFVDEFVDEFPASGSLSQCRFIFKLKEFL